MNDTLNAADGTPLHRIRWPLGPQPAQGTVLLVHGLGEHAGRYAHVAAALNGAGWQVEAYDHRGHGASGGPRGAVPSADALLEDLARVIDAVRAERPGPLVLLGHSMGGAVAARFVAEGLAARPAAWHRPVDALVLSSPALDLGLNAVQRLLMGLVAPLAPNLALANGLDPSWVSRDPAVVAAYRADPRVHDRITGRLARFMLDAGEAVRAAAPRWRTPTLLLWAGSDRCVAPAGSAAFAAAAPAGVVTSRVFPGLAHEIFNEPERAETLGAVLQWLAGIGAAAR